MELMILSASAIVMVTAAIAFLLVAIKPTETCVRKFAVIHVKSQQKEVLKRRIRSRS